MDFHHVQARVSMTPQLAKAEQIQFHKTVVPIATISANATDEHARATERNFFTTLISGYRVEINQHTLQS